MSVIDDFLTRADETFDIAAHLLERQALDAAVSRTYYGYFYVAQALLLSKNLSFSSHGKVIAQYGFHFAKPDILDRRFHKFLDRAFELRQVADYAAKPELNSQVTQELIHEGRAFLQAARAYLQSQEGA